MKTANRIDLVNRFIRTNCNNGQIFTVKFVKKDGEKRTMNCRLGVTKHLQGGKSTTAHKENLMTVFDMAKKGYRSINLETVYFVSACGLELTLTEKEE